MLEQIVAEQLQQAWDQLNFALTQNSSDAYIDALELQIKELKAEQDELLAVA